MKAINHKQLMQNDGLKGGVGVLASIMALMTSLLSDLEQWLRILGLLGSLVLCGFTCWSIWKSNQRKDRGKAIKDDEETTWV